MKDPDPIATRLIGYTLLMVIIAIVCWPLTVQAKDVAVLESRGDRVVLTDQPCTSFVKDQIKAEWRDKFKAATYYVGQKRQTVNGCYMLYGDDYQTIWEDGDIFALPMSMFKQVGI
jgi:hypothetical protein